MGKRGLGFAISSSTYERSVCTSGKRGISITYNGVQSSTRAVLRDNYKQYLPREVETRQVETRRTAAK